MAQKQGWFGCTEFDKYRTKVRDEKRAGRRRSFKVDDIVCRVEVLIQGDCHITLTRNGISSLAPTILWAHNIDVDFYDACFDGLGVPMEEILDKSTIDSFVPTNPKNMAPHIIKDPSSYLTVRAKHSSFLHAARSFKPCFYRIWPNINSFSKKKQSERGLGRLNYIFPVKKTGTDLI
ncbi:hypothetical protein TNCV_3036021 [Trichonephila clavipes]|nr:hypothetical protein TNCV_3036021 [Trichonephila clavipes]